MKKTVKVLSSAALLASVGVATAPISADAATSVEIQDGFYFQGTTGQAGQYYSATDFGKLPNKDKLGLLNSYENNEVFY